MSILKNQLYVSDIELASSSVLNYERLRGSHILVTGASGLICSAVTDMLLHANLDINIYAAGRQKEKIETRFLNRVNFVEYDATKPIDFSVKFDYIIHGASNASPNLYVSQPVETMQANFCGICNLMDYAKSNACKRVLYISSSEVYGEKKNSHAHKENEYGYVDISHVRSSYSVGKRAAEMLCESYRAEYGVDYCTVRPGHIYGPSASKSDNRISSDFAYKAASGLDLVMKSHGSQLRSYCYSLDCASAVLSVLTSGTSGQAYNISNKDSIITVKEMAQYLAHAGGVKLKFEIPTANDVAMFNPMDNSSLDSTKIEQMGWHPAFTPEVGLFHTVQILKTVNG